MEIKVENKELDNLNYVKEQIIQDVYLLESKLNQYGSNIVKGRKRKCIFCNSSDGLEVNKKNENHIQGHCFSCNKNFDVINLVEEKEGLSFYKSLELLANEKGLVLNKSSLSNEDKIKIVKNKKENKVIDMKKSILKDETNKALEENNIDKAFEKSCEIDRATLSDYEKSLIDSLIYNKNGTIGINQLKVGNAILENYKLINNERFFYKYDEALGVWQRITRQTLRTIVTTDLEKSCEYWSDSTTRSISNYVFDKTFGNLEGESFDEVFNKNPYRIVFRNGTLDISNNHFINEFDPHDYNTIVIPHDYNKDASAPIKTINFLSMMTDNIEELNFIFEWIGYLLVKKYDIAKMLFLVGDGGNGKSTLIKLMTCIVGADNTSTVSMKSLINNRFQSALLYNKLFNTVADIGADFFEDSSILKALTGDDHITVERKNIDGFSYLNFAKMTYSCNKLPKFKDTTGGLNRRPIVLPLNKNFMELVKDSDIHINDILSDEEELERVLKYSIDKFRKILENGKVFTESKSMVDAKIEWLSDDPLLDFIGETYQVVENENLYTEMSLFMEAYKMYCIDRNYKPMSQKNVIEHIKNNKILRQSDVDVKRIDSKTKKLKITNIIKLENKNFDWNS